MYLSCTCFLHLLYIAYFSVVFLVQYSFKSKLFEIHKLSYAKI
jgi:hypothetical protein